MMRQLMGVATAIAITLAAAAPAIAQTKPGARPTVKRQKEFLMGGLIAGPSSLGSAQAELLRGSGDPSVTLFREKNSLPFGFGGEAGIGFQLRKTLWMEVAGSWTRVRLSSEISSDFENAPAETITSDMSRFAVQGALLRYFHEKGSSAWFVRVVAGWMRETGGGNTLTGDGVIGGGGIGFRHWWGTNGKGAIKRTGLRIEGRADVRSGGISIGEKGIRFGPAGAVHLVFGF
jgi:hypothetical protein